MNRFKKTVSLSTAALLLAASLCGCSGDKSEKASGDALTYWVTLDTTSAQSITNYSEMLYYQELEKATGVKVDFIHPITGSTGSEAFTTLLASGDLPDMIETNWSGYAGGADAAIDDGVIIRLNEYLEEYAPNYYSYVSDEGGYKSDTMTDKGNYYGFRTLNIGDYRNFSGLMVRKDIIESWGMDIPKTISDWDSLFAKAKSEGYTKPFTCQANPFDLNSTCNTFNTAYGVGNHYYIEDGKVVHGVVQPGYKEFVTQVAEWVSKGYVDKNFVTNQSIDMESNMTADKVSVACFGWIGGTMGKIMPAMETRNPEFDLVACPFPKLDENAPEPWHYASGDAAGPEIAITTACEDIESAMKWCDYIFSPEGSLLKNFGVKGDTYTVSEKDGETHYIYTDKILKPETIGASSVNAALYKFFRPANAPGLNQHPDYLQGYYPYQCQKDALDAWNTNTDEGKAHLLPTITTTTEESARIATLSQQYQSGLDTAISEMILGNRSINEFDSVIEKAKKDYLDEVLKIRNDAYQRYLVKMGNK